MRLNEYGPETGSTSTPNKVKNIEPEIFRIVRSVTSGKGKHAITLVGPEDGLERHVKEFDSIGVPQENLTIVERDIKLLNRLKKKTKEMGYQFKNLVGGDFVDRLKQALKKGYRFKMVDFDGTDSLGSSHLELLKLLQNNPSKMLFLRMTGGVRSPKLMKDAKTNKMLSKHNVRTELYFPKNSAEAMRSIKENLDDIRERLGDNIYNEIKEKLEKPSASKNSSFKINKKGEVADDILFSFEIESRGFSVLLGNYRGRSSMFNILVSKEDLSPYESANLWPPGKFSSRPQKEIMIKDYGKIKVLDSGDIRKANSSDTAYYLIDDKIYHKTYGFLADMIEKGELKKVSGDLEKLRRKVLKIDLEDTFNKIDSYIDKLKMDTRNLRTARLSQDKKSSEIARIESIIDKSKDDLDFIKFMIDDVKFVKDENTLNSIIEIKNYYDKKVKMMNGKVISIEEKNSLESLWFNFLDKLDNNLHH